jgi:hypothetical protein
MEDFLKKISSALKDGDIAEFDRLSKPMVYAILCQSRDKQLIESAYFTSLNPEYPDYFYQYPEHDIDEPIKDFFSKRDADYQKFVDEFYKRPVKTEAELIELRAEAIKRLDDPVLWVTAKWDKEAIEEISSYDFITIFETALLIGYRVERNPMMIIHDLPALFLDALSHKQLDPREPSSNIPYSKLHKTPKAINGAVYFEKDSPDLSWYLTLKEAAEFAILKGYPEYIFNDLMNDNSTANILPAKPSTNTKTMDNNEQAILDTIPTYIDTKATDNEELTENERNKLLRVIGLLAETLANTNPCDLRRKSDNTIVFGNGEAGENNKTNLLKELFDTLNNIAKSPAYGLSKTTLRNTIKEGIKSLHDSL